MIKHFLNIAVLLAFLVSTMPGLSMAMPMADHQMLSQSTVEQSDHQHNSHHVSVNMQADHSCCKDKQVSDHSKKDDHKQCCDGDCQCMMSSCSSAQLFNESSLLDSSFISKGLVFIRFDENYGSSVPYLLKRPPRA